MILLKRTIPILASISIYVLMQVVVARHDLFWYTIPLIAVVHAGGLLYLLLGKTAYRDTLLFFMLPTALLGASIFFLIFLTNALFAQAVMLLIAFLYGWYLENISLFFYQPQQYQPYALEHIAAYENILVFFLFFSALSAARVFLSIPLIEVLIIGFGVTLYLTLQAMWSAKVGWQTGRIMISIHLLVMTELIGIVSLLPTSYLVSGLLLTIPYYFLINLVRHSVHGTLSRRVVTRYVIVSLSTMVLTLVTAPWS